jgi:hypothetical protein
MWTKTFAIRSRKVYRGGLGPFNYHPEEARAWLEKRFASPRGAAADPVAKN